MIEIPVKVYGTIALVVGVMSGIGYYNHVQRDIGAERERTKVARAIVDSLEDELSRARPAFKADTIVLFRRIEHWDSVAALTGALDSARAALARVANVPQAKPETVMVKVPAAFVVGQDSTLQACRAVVSECGRVAVMERQRADALASQVGTLTHGRASVIGDVIRCGLLTGAGYVVGNQLRNDPQDAAKVAATFGGGCAAGYLLRGR